MSLMFRCSCGASMDARDVPVTLRVSPRGLVVTWGCTECRVMHHDDSTNVAEVINWLLAHGSPSPDRDGLKGLRLYCGGCRRQWGANAWGPDRHPRWEFVIAGGGAQTVWVFHANCPRCESGSGGKSWYGPSINKHNAVIISAALDVLLTVWPNTFEVQLPEADGPAIKINVESPTEFQW